MSVTSVQAPIATSALEQLGIHSDHYLTPDAMMMFLSAQLSALDGEIQELFEKQQLIEKVKEQLGPISNQITGVNGEPVSISNEQAQIIAESLQGLKTLDEAAFNEIVTQLQAAGIDVTVIDGIVHTSFPDGELTPEQASSFRNIIDGVSSKLDSSAQLEMIQLQSMMSERQTAIQLATNIVAAIGKSNEAVVGNIR